MTTQKEDVLKHLTAGKTITPAKALTVYGITRLAARIYELKRDGHDIISRLKEDEKGRAYAEYRLSIRDRFGRRKAA